MKVIAVDDEVLALQSIVRELQKIERITEVQGFCSSEETLMYLEANPVDVVFLDIEMEPLSGLALADKIKLNWPKVFIIFVTAYSQYAVEAFQIHAFGYLLKPVNTERIEKELDYIEHLPASKNTKDTPDTIRVQTFGNFEIFVGGKAMKFKRSRSKEVLAYLIDRQGAGACTRELAAVIWGDEPYTRSRQKQMQVLIHELCKTLKDCGAEKILDRRHNWIAILPDEMQCDLFDFLKMDPAALNAYRGEYMSNYSWAELTVAALEEKWREN